MNYEKLKHAEEDFLSKYPGGFKNPEIVEMAKKHKIEKLVEYTKLNFAIERFDDVEAIINSMVKVVSQSSMVSIFEKPKFRDIMKILHENEKIMFVQGLKEFLYGNQAAGFSLMSQILKTYQLAKWTILTVVPYYLKPNEEVFIKPTTVKGIIAYLEIDDIKYSPNANYEFYKAYRDYIVEMKTRVDPSLQVDNAAFSAFFMIFLEGHETDE